MLNAPSDLIRAYTHFVRRPAVSRVERVVMRAPLSRLHCGTLESDCQRPVGRFYGSRRACPHTGANGALAAPYGDRRLRTRALRHSLQQVAKSDLNAGPTDTC